MKRIGVAMVWALFAVSTAYAAGERDASHSDRAASPFLLAQNSSCLRACQDTLKSCLAKVDPGCNSRGCNNEKNACNLDYNDCAKKCGN